ncbi:MULTISPECIES: GNAT family N-acetyltransferase [Bacillus]|uniref:GNAT family N-acetyltransferase n=1 Tax=Bacillus TaxID=1386 RepID=UPI00031AB4F7|nr:MULTISPECIES: GNAT family N-acetyltransferase [Bacillus]
MSEIFTIKPLKTIDELKAMQKLEIDTWGMDCIPTHQTLTAVKNGGIILGGYLGKQLIGFQYSFPGFRNGEAYLCSHMLAIDSAYRGKGLGEQLKIAQKEEALKKGYKLVSWTFDPLETANAKLNVGKLNAICNTYIENCYGEMEGTLTSGLATDRFQVEWYITSDYVKNKQDFLSYKPIHIATVASHDSNFPIIDWFDVHVLDNVDKDEAIYVPITTQFQQMKNEHLDLASDWRMKTRQIFTILFEKDFVLVDVQREKNSSIQYYILVRQDMVQIDR